MKGKAPTWLSLCVPLAVGCGPSSELDRLSSTGPIEGPFYVSSYFAPSGHMGDGQNPGQIVADVAEHCKGRPSGAGGDCYRFTYTPGEMLWAGVYWVYPSNNWGSRPGRTVVGDYSRIRFYAAAEEDSLGVEFIAGGITDMALPYRDTFRVSRFVNIGREFQQYSLDISAESPSSVVGAFAWVSNYPSGTDPATVPPTVVYIDDVVWE